MVKTELTINDLCLKTMNLVLKMVTFVGFIDLCLGFLKKIDWFLGFFKKTNILVIPTNKHGLHVQIFSGMTKRARFAF